jgi:hypothetical protein
MGWISPFFYTRSENSKGSYFAILSKAKNLLKNNELQAIDSSAKASK